MPICTACKNYEYNQRYEKWECSKIGTRSDDYGEFKQGCMCKHDPDLKDYFDQINHFDDVRKEWERDIKFHKEQVLKLRQENSILKERLLKIN